LTGLDLFVSSQEYVREINPGHLTLEESQVLLSSMIGKVKKNTSPADLRHLMVVDKGLIQCPVSQLHTDRESE
jgi:hypothetical protein